MATIRPVAAAEPQAACALPPAAVEQAEADVRRGLDLANRQAFFSAREAFLTALRGVCEALDAADGGRAHGKALAAGLRALDESDEFLVERLAVEAEVDVAVVARSHRTPVVREAHGEQLAPHQARSLYYTYAQEQLAAAVGDASCGSLALYAMGRLHSALSQAQPPVIAAAESKALVFQQAALLANPGNPLAANELGVLLAHAGRYQEAREWLRHSVATLPDPTTWHNLAVVHKRLGETRLAELADKEAQAGGLAAPEASASGRLLVSWVDPQTLVHGASVPAVDHAQRSDTAVPESVTVKTPRKSESRTGLSRWLPWK